MNLYKNMQIVVAVNCQAQHESSDTDIYMLKNYYNPSALAIFLKCTTHMRGPSNKQERNA